MADVAADIGIGVSVGGGFGKFGCGFGCAICCALAVWSSASHAQAIAKRDRFMSMESEKCMGRVGRVVRIDVVLSRYLSLFFRYSLAIFVRVDCAKQRAKKSAKSGLNVILHIVRQWPREWRAVPHAQHLRRA